MSVAIYMALPFALPFAVGGFLKVHGMSPFVYLQKKKKVTGQGIIRYIPAYAIDSRAEKEKILVKNMNRNMQKIYLETEEDIYARRKGEDAFIEK